LLCSFVWVVRLALSEVEEFFASAALWLRMTSVVFTVVAY
jgi:hypothetical protein